MSSKDRLQDFVTSAIATAIADTGAPPIRVEPSTRLVGESSALDSLALVMVVVALERMIADGFGVSLLLSEREDILDPGGPFRTLETLVAYLDAELTRAGAA